MNFSEESNMLLPFFINNVKDFSYDEDNDNKKIKKKIDDTNKSFFNEMYQIINSAFRYVKLIRRNKSNTFSITKIESIKQLPSSAIVRSIPKEYWIHIQEHSCYLFEYKYKILDRNIKISFILLNEKEKKEIHLIENYLERMLMWIYIILKKTDKNVCAKTLSVIIYKTKFKKEFPSDNVIILNNKHVNTAYTTSCQENGEIIIYREEELFKVFIHETFHIFGLDFSDSVNVQLNNKFKKLFPIETNCNIYEAYTEFWARTINCMFVSYFMYGVNKKKDHFMKLTEACIELEQMFSLFQVAKIMDFYGLTYQNLYQLDETSSMMRDNLYREETNVFSYYIICMILMVYNREFIHWCKKHNKNAIFDFQSDIKTKNLFFIFIKERHNSEFLIGKIEKMRNFIKELYQKKMFPEKIKVFNTLRMTLLETV